MRRVHSEEIVQSPNLLRKIGRGQYPSATQTAQTICFCKAVRRYEMISEMECGTRSAFEHSLQIDFIDENAGSVFAGYIRDPRQRGLIGQYAAWIMHISQHNQSRTF